MHFTAKDTPWRFFVAIFIKMTDIVIYSLIQYPCNDCRGVRILVQDKLYKYDILKLTEFLERTYGNTKRYNKKTFTGF